MTAVEPWLSVTVIVQVPGPTCVTTNSTGPGPVSVAGLTVATAVLDETRLNVPWLAISTIDPVTVSPFGAWLNVMSRGLTVSGP